MKLMICMVLTACAGCALKPDFSGPAPTEVPILDASVQAAAAFAVDLQERAMRREGRASRLTLLRIVSAGERPVAGTHYTMDIEVLIDGLVRPVSAPAPDPVQRATVTVWHRASGPQEMTSWTWHNPTL